MIVLLIYLEDYDWLIKIYYAVTTYYTDDILDELDSIDCSPLAYNRAKDLLEREVLNEGFTYTDNEKHVTFIIIGLTETPEEFVNTYDHEKGHAATHIAEYYEIDPYSEQFLYLLGEIGKLMFTVAKLFMCEHCRAKLVVNFNNYGKMKVKVKTKFNEEG